MSFGHLFSVWWRNLFQRDRVERDLDEELQAYIELLTQRKVQAGMTAEAARHEALLETGGVEQVKEACREARRLHWLDEWKQDASYGLRLLRRDPGFTAAAMLTLSLGIGATTAIFAVVNGVLLRPLPYPQPDRLVYIKEDFGRGNGAIIFATTSHYLAWRSQSSTLSQIGAYIDSPANLSGGGEPERINCGTVTASFLPLVGAKPLLGRSLLPEDDRPGAAPVIVLSHALWLRRFGGDPRAVGRVLTVEGENYTIVGVLPSSFRIPDRYSGAPDAWVPMLSKTGAARTILLRIVGQLKPGVSLETAHAELDTILRSSLRPGQKNRVVMTKWHEEVAGGARFLLLVFLGAASFVLLIACTNVANLLLSRATVRQKEMAVRSALGAGKARILRQLFTESMLLALGGAAVGLVLAVLGKDLLVEFISKSLPTLDPIRLDPAVLGFNLSLAVVVGLAFGLAPGLRASRAQLHETLSDMGRGSTEARAPLMLRDLLVIFEVALAMVLLVGAGLLLKSFMRVRGLDQGYSSDRILSLTIDLTPSRYREPTGQAMFFQTAMERIRNLEGVQSVAVGSSLPLGGYSEKWAGVKIQGGTEGIADLPAASVSPDYFRTMGIPFRYGRDFGDEDGEVSPAILVVNESFARRYCPQRGCVGTRVGPLGKGKNPMTIVGIVGDVRPWLEQQASPEMYLPYLQHGSPHMNLVVRTAGDPMKLAAVVRSQVAGIDKDQPLDDLMTLEQRRSEVLAPRRVNLLLIGVFASLAAVLGAIGIYGVLSYSVSQRAHEIGVRIVLGARPEDVLWSIIRRSLLLIILGEALGLTLALALSKALMISSMLFQVDGADTSTYAVVSLAWIVVGFFASYLPARKASKADPMAVLRCV